MKTFTKSTLNTIEEVLTEINNLIAQKEKEDYAKIFVKRSNLTSTYQSNEYLTIMDISSTLASGSVTWQADFSL
ncbi:hypothetical protein [Emticicia sp. 17c]|uniref:hypothetical protein n=1 Tax=Emticicia sp. 17c TaxID=3127704 RepID=UPI00301E474F